jgi:hypothetical protein
VALPLSFSIGIRSIPTPECSVDRHRGADELFKGSIIELLPFAEINRSLQLAAKASS